MNKNAEKNASSLGERIQSLRKSRGISQEELADRMGVSRQAVSKWESGQNIPDLEKIILLSDYFETTTDYLLKGIIPAKDEEKKWNAILFSTAGTILNAAGLLTAVFIWMERQISSSAGIGLAIMLIGTGIYLTGQIIDGKEKARAKYLFLLPNIWLLPFIPMACCFNIVSGFAGGFNGLIAPLPLLGNSLIIFILYWVIYIALCIAADLILVRKKP